MKRLLALGTAAAVSITCVALGPADAGAAKVTCKVKEGALSWGVVEDAKIRCPRAKLRGPRGPRGRPAAGGGVFPLRFLVEGNSPPTVVASGPGIELVAECSGGGFTAATVARSTANGASVAVTTTPFGLGQSTDARLDSRFDLGESWSLVGTGDDVRGSIEFASAGVGEVFTAQYALADGSDAPANSSCAMWGTYSSP